MAKNYRTDPVFTGRIGSDTTNYPYGDSQDDTGSNDGMPHVKSRADDILGFLQAILVQANITPNGNSDTALNSQYLDGLIEMMAGGKKNLITNPDMFISQRATSWQLLYVGSTLERWTLDRWHLIFSGSTGAVLDLTQEEFTITGPTIPAPSSHFARFAMTVANPAVQFRQFIALPANFLNKTFTLSFYANSSVDMNVQGVLNYRADDGSTGTADSDLVVVTTASGWTRYSMTLSPLVPTTAETYGDNDSAALILSLLFFTQGTLDITAIQLEVNTVETAFEKVDRQQEFLECLRYYQRFELGDVFPGYWVANNEAFITVPFKVPMQDIPSFSNGGPSVDFKLGTSTPSFTGGASGTQTLNTFTNPVSVNQALLTINVSPSTSGTAGEGTLLKLHGTTYMAFEAEVDT